MQNIFCHDSLDIDFTVYTGEIFGKSRELVYGDDQSLLSSLNWDIRNLSILGLEAQKKFFNRRLNLKFNGWGRLTSSDTIMIDKDWLDPDNRSKLTHISRSTARVTEAYMLQLEAQYAISTLHFGSFSLSYGVQTGYQYTSFKWEAIGGKYSYNSGIDQGSFPHILGIAYSQHFSVPYVGLYGKWQKDNWNCSLFGNYSGLVLVLDHDFHALRDATFNSFFKGGRYFMLGAETEWKFTENLSFQCKYAHEQLLKVRGNTAYVEPPFSFGYFENNAGISHYHHLFQIGLKADF